MYSGKDCFVSCYSPRCSRPLSTYQLGVLSAMLQVGSLSARWGTSLVCKCKNTPETSPACLSSLEPPFVLYRRFIMCLIFYFDIFLVILASSLAGTAQR